jgi:predicted kinase
MAADSPQPRLIILSGLPGAGKTTIARLLARRLRAVHVRIDTIEHAIRRSAAHAALPMDDAGYRVGYGLAEDNLRLGLIVIADSVNPWPETREAWRAVARRGRVDLIEVEVICSDVTEHRRRIESRAADLEDFRLPAWPDVVSRDYRDWDGERLVIDTARQTPAEAAQAIIDALGSGERPPAARTAPR